MPSKRDVLSLFSRDELLAIVDRYELPLVARRVKGQPIDRVASRRRR